MEVHRRFRGRLDDLLAQPWLNAVSLTVGVFAVGVVLRAFAVGRFEPNSDAYWYAIDAGTSLTEIWTGTPDGALPRTPIYASAIHLVYLVVGDLGLALATTSFLASVAALVVVYACTRDLWGTRAAIGTTAIVAVDPLVLALTGWGYTLNLALIFFTLTLWAIMKSLERPPFIALAGVFAALAYLTRSSLGVFFLIASGMGVLWRLFFGGSEEGSGASFDRWYLLGGAVFGTTVLAWNLHNYALAGRFSANPGIADASTVPLAEPGSYLVIFALQLLYLGTVAAVYGGFFPAELRDSLARARDSELESGLWTAVSSVVVTSAAVTAGLWFFEDSPIFRSGHSRYAALATIPLAWIVLRPEARRDEAPSGVGSVSASIYFGVMTILSRAWALLAGVLQLLRRRDHTQRLIALVAALFVVSAATLVVVAPISTHPSRTNAMQTVDELSEPGDSVYVQQDVGRIGARSLRVTPDMLEMHAPGVSLAGSTDERPDWVIRWQPWPGAQAADAGYHLVDHYRDAEGLEADLVATLEPLGVRNAETYVYHRCPEDGGLVDVEPVTGSSACSTVGASSGAGSDPGSAPVEAASLAPTPVED
jgi:hypothetical protein